MRVSNGLPAGTAYKASGEIDPKIKESPPKDIVNKIRNTIESPSRVKSPPKPRCEFRNSSRNSSGFRFNDFADITADDPYFYLHKRPKRSSDYYCKLSMRTRYFSTKYLSLDNHLKTFHFLSSLASKTLRY